MPRIYKRDEDSYCRMRTHVHSSTQTHKISPLIRSSMRNVSAYSYTAVCGHISHVHSSTQTNKPTHTQQYAECASILIHSCMRTHIARTQQYADTYADSYTAVCGQHASRNRLNFHVIRTIRYLGYSSMIPAPPHRNAI